MKLSVFLDHLLHAQEQSGKSLEEIFQLIKEWGITALELEGSYVYNNPAIIEKIKAAGLKVSSIYETHNFPNSLDFTSAKKHIDLAKELGAKSILVIPGFFSQEEADLYDGLYDYEKTAELMSNSKACKNIVEMLIKCVEYGKTQGVTITLEDYDGYTSPCSHTYQLLWFMEKVPGLKHSFDTGNFAFSGEDNAPAFDLLHKYIAHFHCKDRLENLECPPVGYGKMNIKSFVEKVKALGYDDYLAIEHFGVSPQLEYIQKSAEFLRQFL